ncbi:RagB/SusD family nutrient uptake outer membrane protein [Chitinophaga sancti]|uniref:RagB/SusD domain-containing protein n=1 Tax=Chitinophaga sancti TaxID=1004 RepID=A0A1K1NJC4_9BACT|nr:RagB/SusD family nutrient uptake outer membrane protein [Chitinophaga sancti]WQD63174.1 RagB/SusD family nutrient uptake outer membrane protein [Chitinophaga sancti]WQG91200.1 RagB/SusD family nutrient uptake outer membrane protein [Chitinophaga sancti]SFW35419.1 RagB/SusD domain-containing protein [Chitinophaga sancti]
MKHIIIALCALVLLNACQKGEINSLNTPVVGGVTGNPTRSDLFNLVTGAESGMRISLSTYLDAEGIIGREIYRFSSSEPRFTTDLLGGGTKVLDNNTFYLTNPWASRYQVVRQCFILLEALSHTSNTVASDAQKKGFSGYAKTLIGYQLLLNINLTDSSGARIPVANGVAQGPVITDPGIVLDSVLKFLDEGKADLTGADVIFSLSDGFAGFKDAAGLLKFNRALAARVHLYRKQWADALTALNESFFDLNGDLNTGVWHYFSTSGGDMVNLSYIAPNNNGEVRIAHPTFATDILPGDDRINKTQVRNSSASQGGLTGNRDVIIWTSLNAPVSIIRNEELVLIYAEANIQNGNFPNALTALNRIRTAHNLPAYAGAVTTAALTSELIYNRRYSLFMEGHRWIDMRRFGLLKTLPVDRPDDDVWSHFPLPQSESNQ